jgi:hypothetical protein
MELGAIFYELMVTTAAAALDLPIVSPGSVSYIWQFCEIV